MVGPKWKCCTIEFITYCAGGLKVVNVTAQAYAEKFHDSDKRSTWNQGVY